jgi:phosphomannomutase
MSIRLAFGTAGIRAPLGAGDDQMNERTVRAVAFALADYLAEAFAGARGRGICLAYDGRTDSDTFAQTFREVLLGFGFRVRSFAQPVPTPLLAFCTRYHDAVCGVMITASHNPPSDNGIKIYLERGAQVLAPHDAEIARRIGSFDVPPAIDPALREGGLDEPLGEREVEAYLGAIERLIEHPSSAPLPRIAYSALAGVGSPLAHRLFARAGAHDVHEVAEEAAPRSDFAGLTTPNPEHASALARLCKLADDVGATLLFAHDPDADRLAVAVRANDGSLRMLTGDEVGALLGSFLLAAQHDKVRTLLVSTLVSGELLEHVARGEGATFERTATGFKWIASRARELERERGLSFVFGYEEAIGYAFGAIADDKDGIAALYVLLELARRLHAQNRTLLDELDELSRRHGVFSSRQVTVPRGGTNDILAQLRALDPSVLLGPGATAIDYRTRPERLDLLIVRGPDGSKLCARPSGTEPKLKLYLHVRVPVAHDVDGARRIATEKLSRLETAVRRLATGA